MAVTVTHQFVSAISDSGDTSIVQPSDWNDTHTVSGLGTMAEATAADYYTSAETDSAIDTAISATTVTTTRGDLIRRGVSADERVALGTSGYLLGSDGTDAVWAGYTQTGTGATTRTWADKASDFLNAADFGFSSGASGATNKTALDNALTRAAAIGRSGVILPGGQFSITGTVSSLASNVSIMGQGKAQTVLVQQTASAPTFALSGDYVGVMGLGISYASTPTSGADVLDMSGDYALIYDVWIIASYRAIVLSGDGTSISQSKISNCVVNGILATGVVGGRWSNIQIEAGSTSNASAGCISLLDGTEAIEASNIECLEGLYSLATDATTPGFGTEPAYHHFSNCIFDAAARGSLMTDVSTSVFTNCWFSGGRSDSGYPGLTLDNCTDVTLSGCTFTNCGSSGLSILATSSNIRVFGGIAGSNSVTAGSGVNSGIEIAANTNDVSIVYPTGGNGQAPGGQQAYDVTVAAGTSARVVVRVSSAGGVTGVATHGGTGVGNIMEVTGTVYQGGSWVPFVNDGGAIGALGQGISDLFAASGATFNIDSGNWVATHSSGILTVGTGDLRVTTAGTNAASVVTVGGTQTLTNKTLTTPTLTGLTTMSGSTASNIGLLLGQTVNNAGGASFGLYMGSMTLAPANGSSAFFQYAGGGAVDTTGITVTEATGFFSAAMSNTGGGTITTAYGAYFATQTAGSTNWSMYSQGDALFGGVVRINQAASTVGTGTKTISNAADSSTNFGKYFSLNLNGTTVYIPCSTVAPT